MTTVKRRMAMLITVSAVSGLLTVSSATVPAQGVPDEVCVVEGNAHLSSALTYPTTKSTNQVTTQATIHLHAHSALFTIHLTTGTCLPSGTQLSATGSVHGWCGLSVGSGVTSQGDLFHWIGVGGTLVLTGGATGVVNATPNPLTGDSCVTGADDFLVNGASIGNSCNVVNLPSVSVLRVSIGNSVDPIAHASGHFGMEASFCG